MRARVNCLQPKALRFNMVLGDFSPRSLGRELESCGEEGQGREDPGGGRGGIVLKRGHKVKIRKLARYRENRRGGVRALKNHARSRSTAVGQIPPPCISGSPIVTAGVRLIQVSYGEVFIRANAVRVKINVLGIHVDGAEIDLLRDHSTYHLVFSSGGLWFKGTHTGLPGAFGNLSPRNVFACSGCFSMLSWYHHAILERPAAPHNGNFDLS